MDPHLELKTKFGPPFDVRSFTIREEISRPFEVYVSAQSTDPDVLLEALVNQTASFKIDTANPALAARSRSWEGICQRAQHIRAEDGYKDGVAYSTYVIHIVARLWLLSTNRNNRIFQRMTLPEIVVEILDEWSIDHKLVLNQSYRKLDYVVQYGESDLVFITRILERAGICYFFDDSLLTLSDEPHLGAERSRVTYDPNRAERSVAENVHTATVVERITPGKVTVRDFDFRRPKFNLIGESPAAKAPEDAYELYRYRPGISLALAPSGIGPATPTADDKGAVRHIDDEVEAIATRELEAHRARKRTVMFTTNCIDLCPGTVFKIDGHPYPDVGEKLLMTLFEMSGSTEAEFQQSGTAVLANVPYRPELRQPPPLMQGMQSATVVGPKRKEIYTDEFGRVRVQFWWDREGKKTDDSSCWIRVNQPWAGRGFGKVVLPRIGHEVVIRYEEGDVDRPLLMGRAYNAINVIPQENTLPTYDTRSSWMSDTSPHKDNSFNVIQFEDALDNERIFTQAQRDQQKLVKNDETERTGQNRLELVGNNRATIVGAVDARLVGAKFSLQMIRRPIATAFRILKMGIPDVTPLPTKFEMVDSKILCTTKDATVMFDGADITFEAKKSITMKAGGTIIVHGAPNIHVNPAGGGGSGALAGQAVPEADDPIVGVLGSPSAVRAIDPLMAPYEPEPEPPPIPEAPEIVEEPDCMLLSSTLVCQHGRAPNADPEHKKFHVLQIVPEAEVRAGQANINTWAGGSGPYSMNHKRYVPAGDGSYGVGEGEIWQHVIGDKIKLDSTVQAQCDDHTLWAWRGPGLNDTSKGSLSADFTVAPWVYNSVWAAFHFGTGDLPGLFGKKPDGIDLAARGVSWSGSASPSSYRVTGSACSVSHSYTVEAFPCDRMDIKLTFDLTKLVGRLDGWVKYVKTFADRLGGLKTELQSNITLRGQASWKEHTDWRAFYCYDVSINGEPLIGVKADFTIPVTSWLAGPVLGPILVGLQAWAGDKLDLGSIHIALAIEGAGTIGAKVMDPDAGVQFYGQFPVVTATLSVYLQAFLWSRWFASMRVEGRTSGTVEFSKGDSTTVQAPRVGVKATWFPLVLEVDAGVLWWHKSSSYDLFKKKEWEGSFPIMPQKLGGLLGLNA